MTLPCRFYLHLIIVFIMYFYLDIDSSLIFFLLWLQVHCGRQPCLLQSDSGEPQHPLCPLGQKCVAHDVLSCLRPPCSQLGICSTSESLQPIRTRCLPNNGYLDDNCAHVTLVFDSDSVPQVSVFHLVNAESFERQIHYLLSQINMISSQSTNICGMFVGLFNRAQLLKVFAQS